MFQSCQWRFAKTDVEIKALSELALRYTANLERKSETFLWTATMHGVY
jgi:hypothetical protein